MFSNIEKKKKRKDVTSRFASIAVWNVLLEMARNN